ncbi:hypothetical protein [Streptomyces sp. ODS28]|uniref:hypothetical protein n=1 Tax=Streptomyces sp. ODS28 TaxID=3136688 RepID=UPI0031EAEE52
MSHHAARYEIAVTPQPPEEEAEASEAEVADTAVRREWVHATGETGASGYPRYAGEGLVADIDPAGPSVEAITVDGAELTYGWTADVVNEERGRAD